MYVFEVQATHPHSLECQDLAADLLRAYTRYFDNNAYRINTIKFEEGEVGVKHAICLVFWGLGYLSDHSGIYRVCKRPKWINVDKISSHTASIQLYPVNDDLSIKVKHDKPSGAGGCVPKIYYLKSSTDRHTLTLEQDQRPFSGRHKWEPYERDAEMVLRAKYNYTPSETLVMQARYQPEFYCKFQGKDWSQERLVEFWDGKVCD